LEQLDRNRVGRADEGHAAVARRTVDHYAGIDQPLAGRIDIVDLIGEMAEIAAAAIAAFAPIVRELDLPTIVAGDAEEDEVKRPASLSIRRRSSSPRC
jgi:hypothetical protein